MRAMGREPLVVWFTVEGAKAMRAQALAFTAAPFAIEAVTLIYNKALVAAPPKTFEDVFALDAQLQKQGKRALIWDYTNNYFTWPLLAAHGGYAFKQRPDGSFDARDCGLDNTGALVGI